MIVFIVTLCFYFFVLHVLGCIAQMLQQANHIERMERYNQDLVEVNQDLIEENEDLQRTNETLRFNR